uniref:ERM domain-containing protein n=1 Tax=Caenorhabditis tropicalis TaxID=1561998 RepID=A0A1I7TI44_9PELO
MAQRAFERGDQRNIVDIPPESVDDDVFFRRIKEEIQEEAAPPAPHHQTTVNYQGHQAQHHQPPVPPSAQANPAFNNFSYPSCSHLPNQATQTFFNGPGGFVYPAPAQPYLQPLAAQESPKLAALQNDQEKQIVDLKAQVQKLQEEKEKPQQEKEKLQQENRRLEKVAKAAAGMLKPETEAEKKKIKDEAAKKLQESENSIKQLEEQGSAQQVEIASLQEDKKKLVERAETAEELMNMNVATALTLKDGMEARFRKSEAENRVLTEQLEASNKNAQKRHPNWRSSLKSQRTSFRNSNKPVALRNPGLGSGRKFSRSNQVHLMVTEKDQE